MNAKQKATAKKILNAIVRQSFSDSYNGMGGKIELYITDNPVKHEQGAMEDVVRLFRIDNEGNLS